MILIKNVDLYAPEFVGVKDILIAGKKIEWIDDEIKMDEDFVKVIDGSGLKAIPGIIDSHVHIIGGGGEGGMTTRVPQVQISQLIENGITTVLGLLGTDGTTRTVEELVAKAKAINEIGLTAYALTGSYEYPTITLTNNVKSDMCYISEIIGAKTAVSDHRSSNMTQAELLRLASDVYVGGKLSGKQGLLTIHMGDGKRGLTPIVECLEESDLPIAIFRPTHVNRNLKLLEQSIEFMKSGGYIDLTCGSTGLKRPAVVIDELVTQGVTTDTLTISSDGNGSYSTYDESGKLLMIGAASLNALMTELKYMVLTQGTQLDLSLPYFTSNVANALGLGDSKGQLKNGFDADILLLNDELEIDSVIANGELMMADKKIEKVIPFN